MTPDVDNKYDNLATVVKTLDEFVVRRVAKAFTKLCRVMVQTVDVLAVNLQVSFIKLNGNEVKERNGKYYWEDQPEIRIEFVTDKKSIQTIRERLLKIAKKWKGIELIEVEEEVEEDVEEPKTKRGDHVGFGDIIGEEGDTLALEGADEIPYHKLFKKRTE